MKQRTEKSLAKVWQTFPNGGNSRWNKALLVKRPEGIADLVEKKSGERTQQETTFYEEYVVRFIELLLPEP